MFLLSLAAVSMFAMDGKAIYGAKCVMCHGTDGKKTVISGKAIAGDADVLSKLEGYKQGTFGGAKKSSMKGVLSNLGDADLKAVASYVQTLKEVLGVTHA